ncbi:mannose-P-dolichol utilization defect 1 protein [Coniophora puteana RWD-64-598 SS2]|uniref:Mannose-P-dolichol utilization defect 1 protein homolog n=1 Tax=Coniophora puteana (strain RWD-64-598) TaxID=741705 RepID=A0A5M3MYV0_CONPW|nr:mannose-P-dolichol utilization defect 1 protein [Coniophora puteana RWD-64-598 SS2]EIW83825.1 mannose-P-dolichol utilization defect 1 protein [Coniophora puteana RWD-64-598 SS2]
MTAITKNLPWFIRDLGVSIVGQKCYESIVEDLNLGDVECLKYSLSKGLGLGIVVGGSIMKVPQLLLILNARSARGLSLSAYVLETLAYAITTSYAFRNNFPFSTYGENLFLAIQNTIITLLIVQLTPSPPSLSKPAQSTAPRVLAGAGAAALAFVALYAAPSEALSALQLATLPLSVLSKLPQIRQNARARSTGQLSAFAVIAQVGGCAARLFTTAAEVGDMLVAAGFVIALLLNVVLAAQMWMYWGRDDVPSAVPASVMREKVPQDQIDVVVPPKSPLVPRQGLPRTASPIPRRWSRKVD